MMRIQRNILLLLILAAGITPSQSQTIKLTPLIRDSVAYLDSLYQLAMLDARNPTPAKITHQLDAITPDAGYTDTIMEGKRYIRMVSWKLDPSFYPDSGWDTTDNSHFIWVTIASLMKKKCQFYADTLADGVDVNMRIRQLLGLQPFTAETFFLELYVQPEDLFRPCPDNEIDDNTCGLSLPEDVDDWYREWFNHVRAVQYTDCTDIVFHQNGYPWTQLGYTYDWSPDSKDHIGMSEYVIRPQSRIYVRKKIPNLQYYYQED